MRLPLVSTALLLSLSFPCAHAFGTRGIDVSDAAGIAQLEIRADHADAREQCFLYTELVHLYTELAGKQLAAGETTQASATLKRVQHFAERIHLGLARDTKRLKNAEILMHNASFHLGEYRRLVSSEDQEMVQATRKQLDMLNDELLAQVFAH